jgi:hypothetical protein
MQSTADEASAAERAAAARVAAVLEPLGIQTIEELARRRDRYRELLERRAEVGLLAERARDTRARMEVAAATFDTLAANLVPPAATRARTLVDAKAQEARKSARDGIDLRLLMLDVRRSDVLGSDDEFALEAELTELLGDGVEPAPPAGASHRAFEAERADLERRASELRSAAIGSAAELRAAEAQIGDLPALDERVGHLHEQAERLERFERAVGLARQTTNARARRTKHSRAVWPTTHRPPSQTSRASDISTSGSIPRRSPCACACPRVVRSSTWRVSPPERANKPTSWRAWRWRACSPKA